MLDDFRMDFSHLLCYDIAQISYIQINVTPLAVSLDTILIPTHVISTDPGLVYPWFQVIIELGEPGITNQSSWSKVEMIYAFFLSLFHSFHL